MKTEKKPKVLVHGKINDSHENLNIKSELIFFFHDLTQCTNSTIFLSQNMLSDYSVYTMTPSLLSFTYMFFFCNICPKDLLEQSLGSFSQ